MSAEQRGFFQCMQTIVLTLDEPTAAPRALEFLRAGEIIALPVVGGSKAYLAWLEQGTRP